MASLHRHGRVLSERSTSHLDRLVRSASAALVSCSHGFRDFISGTWPYLDRVPAAPLANRTFLRCFRLAGSRHPDRKLHLPQLPCSRVGSFYPGLPLLLSNQIVFSSQAR